MNQTKPIPLYKAFCSAAEAEVVVDSLVEELLERANNFIYDRYLEAKHLPFVLSQAIMTLVNVLELEFIRIDIGHTNPWPEDPEPMPCPIDAWGRSAISVKQKYKVVKPRPPPSPLGEGSSRSPLSTISRISQFMKSRLRNRNSARPIGEKVYEVVQLPEEKVEVTSEEAILRFHKETESDRLWAEKERIRIIHEAEQEREREAARRVQELKNKTFTFDYKGRIMLQRKIMDHKSPTVEPEFNVIADLSPTPDKRPLMKIISKRDLPSLVTKRPSEKHVEFVRNIQASQPPLYDNIKLSSGVLVRDGNLNRSSHLKSQVRTLSRQQYRQVTETNTTSLDKSRSSQSSSLRPRGPEDRKENEENVKSAVVTTNSHILLELPDIAEEKPLLSNLRISPEKSKTSRALTPITMFWEDMEDVAKLSEVDKFNFTILKNTNWGNNPPLRTPSVPARLPSRPTAKNLQETYGYRTKLPRERPHIEAFTSRSHLAPPPPRKTMGHGLISVKSEKLASLRKLERSYRPQ